MFKVSSTLQFDRPDMGQEYQSLAKQMVHNRGKLQTIEHNMLEAINSTDAVGIVETDDIYNAFTQYQKAALEAKKKATYIQGSQVRIGEIRQLYQDKLASKVQSSLNTEKKQNIIGMRVAAYTSLGMHNPPVLREGQRNLR